MLKSDKNPPIDKVSRSRDFGPILDDYSFYLEHSTEEEADRFAIMGKVLQKIDRNSMVRMLDFGCGNGLFTSRILDWVQQPPEHLELVLVDIGEKIRLEAMAKLQPFSQYQIQAADQIPQKSSPFDIIIANHVLYYIDNLDQVIQKMWNLVKRNGTFFISIAGNDNTLIDLWKLGFDEIEKPLPYHISEDIEQILQKGIIPYQKKSIDFEIQLQDSRENRLRMIRFLFSDHISSLPLTPLINFFDKYAAAGQIFIQTSHDLYILEK